MSSIATHLDQPYAQQPETRAAAARFLERTGNADLVPMLGLDEPGAPLAKENGRELCPSCGKPLPDPIANGGRKPCRRRTCVPGQEAEPS